MQQDFFDIFSKKVVLRTTILPHLPIKQKIYFLCPLFRTRKSMDDLFCCKSWIIFVWRAVFCATNTSHCESNWDVNGSFNLWPSNERNCSWLPTEERYSDKKKKTFCFFLWNILETKVFFLKIKNSAFKQKHTEKKEFQKCAMFDWATSQLTCTHTRLFLKFFKNNIRPVTKCFFNVYYSKKFLTKFFS